MILQKKYQKTLLEDSKAPQNKKLLSLVLTAHQNFIVKTHEDIACLGNRTQKKQTSTDLEAPSLLTNSRCTS